MNIEYAPKGVCSRLIKLQVEDDVVVSSEFVGGCSGNLQGICKLIQGMRVDEVVRRLEGIRCQTKPTSCPDQLAQALKANFE